MRRNYLSITLIAVIIYAAALIAGVAAAFLPESVYFVVPVVFCANISIGLGVFLYMQSVHRRNDYARELNRLDILDIINSVASNTELEPLLEQLLSKLMESLKSNWGVFYLANNATNKLEIKASVGFSKNIYSEFDLTIGEGLVGTAALKRKTVIIGDIPDDTVYITKTFLGSIKPKNLMLVPVTNQDQLLGVLALGSIYSYANSETELIDLIKPYIGAAIGNCVIYERSKRLTNELKFQNKLIQDLNGELEAKMNERELFMGGVLNSIKDYAIYATDIYGAVLAWNTGAEVLFGHTAVEIIGKNIQMIYSAEDVESGYIRQRIERVLTDGFYSEKIKGRNVSSHFALYDESGQVIGITTVAICKHNEKL